MAVNQNDILRVAARMHLGTHGDLVNVYHFRKSDATPQTDGETRVDLSLWIDELYDEIDNYLSVDLDFIDINYFNVTQDRPLGSGLWPTLVAGTRTGHPLPAQLAVFLQGNTGYSRNWARKFIGGFSENENSATGFLEALLLSAMAGFAARWLSGPVAAMTGDWDPVVFHYDLNDYREIIEVIIRNVWSTVRRRRAGRGD